MIWENINAIFNLKETLPIAKKENRIKEDDERKNGPALENNRHKQSMGRWALERPNY